MQDRRANFPRVAMIGFGEAARAFVTGWSHAGSGRISAYDIKSGDPSLAPALDEAYRDAGVNGHAEPGPALAGAELVFCLVTADQALAAATAAAPYLVPGAFWFDGNSCAPGTKRAAAEVIAAASGRYVDVAIMAPVHPKLNRTPLLVAGEAAREAADVLRGLDMQLEVSGERVGDASAIKMIRSVMIKGIEALTAECLLAARRAGVDEAVVASLQASDPAIDWSSRSAYCLERMIVHGNRRAAEMREVAATLREFGLPDRMASATSLWEDDIGRLKLGHDVGSYADLADRILAALK